jgi:hypothetical protein
MEVYLLAYIILTLYVGGRIHSPVALKPPVTHWVGPRAVWTFWERE